MDKTKNDHAKQLSYEINAEYIELKRELIKQQAEMKLVIRYRPIPIA